MSEQKKPVPVPYQQLWTDFRIAMRPIDEGYTCTLEARRASGGLGNHTAKDESPASGGGLAGTSRGCYYN